MGGVGSGKLVADGAFGSVDGVVGVGGGDRRADVGSGGGVFRDAALVRVFSEVAVDVAGGSALHVVRPGAGAGDAHGPDSPVVVEPLLALVLLVMGVGAGREAGNLIAGGGGGNPGFHRPTAQGIGLRVVRVHRPGAVADFVGSGAAVGGDCRPGGFHGALHGVVPRHGQRTGLGRQVPHLDGEGYAHRVGAVAARGGGVGEIGRRRFRRGRAGDGGVIGSGLAIVVGQSGRQSPGQGVVNRGVAGKAMGQGQFRVDRGRRPVHLVAQGVAEFQGGVHCDVESQPATLRVLVHGPVVVAFGGLQRRGGAAKRADSRIEGQPRRQHRS